jgi:hypothetical protein
MHRPKTFTHWRQDKRDGGRATYLAIEQHALYCGYVRDFVVVTRRRRASSVWFSPIEIYTAIRWQFGCCENMG